MARRAAQRFAFLLLSCSLLAGVARPASADDASERRLEQLESLVETLVARVAELEGRLAEAEDVPPEPAPPAPPAVRSAADPSGLSVSWRRGLRFRSADRSTELRLGAYLQQDFSFLSADDSLSLTEPVSDGVEFRRLRLALSGEVGRHLEFETEVDFAGDERTEVKDAFIGFRDLPGNLHVRVGRMKEPFGLENQSSGKGLSFLERGLTRTFAPGRNSGVLLQGHAADQRFNWAIGGFRNTDWLGRSAKGDEGVSLTARVAGTPWRRDGEHLLHLGASYSKRDAPGNIVRLQATPAMRFGPTLADTFLIPMRGDDERTGVDLALVHGPFSFQAEHAQARLNVALGAPLEFWASDVFASLFITGESRNYRDGRGSFGRLRPRSHFIGGDGPGAWEVAGRWSKADLDEGFINGGKLEDFTLGVNWYLSDALKLGMNWVRSELEGEGRLEGVVLRTQLTF